jgi:outer membrane protein TolC
MHLPRSMRIVFLLLLYGGGFGHAYAAGPQSSLRMERPSSGAISAEEPRGALSLRDVLSLTLLRNPELSAFTFELRATEARMLQAGLLPNPALSAELENVGGTGPATRGARATETTLQLSQLIELGGKRAKRMRLAGLERELTQWDYEVKCLEVLTEAKKAFVDVLVTAKRKRAPLFDVLDVQRTLFETRGHYLEALATYHRWPILSASLGRNGTACYQRPHPPGRENSDEKNNNAPTG